MFKKNISALTGVKSPVEHDSLDTYLRQRLGVGADDVIATLMTGAHLQPREIPVRSIVSTGDYGGFLMAVRDRAAQGIPEDEPGRFRQVFTARGLPVPNLLTFLYDRLDVPSWRQRHVRGIGGSAITGMHVLANLGASMPDVVELSYLRESAESINPDARLTLYPGREDVTLQAYGPLEGIGDIADVPGAREAISSDVLFVARTIVAALYPEQPPR